MSSRLTLFKHPLRNDKDERIVDAGQTIAEALAKDIAPEHLPYLIVYQNGQKVDDLSAPVLDDSFIVARVVPEGAAGQIVGGIAAIMVGVVLSATGIGGVLGAGLIYSGVGLIAGGLLTQDAQGTVVDPKSSLSRPGLTGGSNSTNPRGKVPYILGTHRITPYYGAAPYTSIGGTDGIHQYLHMLYVVGYSKLAVSDLRIGDKLLATNVANEDDGAILVDGNFPAADAEVEIRQLGAIPTLYDASGWTIKESAVNAGLGNFRNATSNAGISGGELGSLTITINATNKTIVRSAGNWGTAGVQIGDIITLTGMSNAGNNYPMLVTNVSGTTLTCYEATSMVSEGPTASVSATVAPANIVKTAKRVRKLSWTIEFPRGLLKWNVNTAENYALPVKCYYRQVGGTDGSWVAAPAWTGEAGTTITRNKNITMRFTTVTADLGTDYTGEYETRVVVEQPAANNDSTYTYVEECKWSSLRTHHAVAPVSQKVDDKVVMIAVKLRASYQLKDTIEEFNLLATPVLTRSGAGSDEASIRARPTNPAASFVHACMGSINPRPVAAAKMDFATLKAWADSCDTLGLTCNGIVSSGVDMRTLLQQISSAGRAMFYKKDMLYSVAHDIAKSTTVAHITPRNSWDFSYTRSFEALPHGFRINFPNEEQDYEDDERLVLGDGYIYDTENDGSLRDAFGTVHTTAEAYLPGQNYIEATEFEGLSLPFVTKPSQIWKAGRYAWECRKYRNTIYSVSMDIEQLVVTLGDKARFNHSTLSQALMAARILRLNYDVAGDVKSVTLDAPVTLAATYGCRIRTPSSSIYRALSNAAGDHTTLVFTSVIATADAPPVGSLVMTGPAGDETEEVIVTGVQVNDDYSATLTLVPYAQEVFNADNNTPATFYSRIIRTARGVVARAIESDEYALTVTTPKEDEVNVIGNVSVAAGAYTDASVPRFRGSLASDPATDNRKGDYYYNTASSKIRAYTGSAWADASGAFTAAGVGADPSGTAAGLVPRFRGSLTTDPTSDNREGDYYYNTTSQKIRAYASSAWADASGKILTAAEVNTAVATYAPKHLGRVAYASLSGTAGNPGDSIVAYSATIGECGIYKMVATTWTDQTSPTTELIMLAWSDILWATANSYPSTGTATEKVQAYMGSGVNYFETLAANTAFIANLFAQTIGITGALYTSNVTYGDTYASALRNSWGSYAVTDGYSMAWFTGLNKVFNDYLILASGTITINIAKYRLGSKALTDSVSFRVVIYKNGSSILDTNSTAWVKSIANVAVTPGDIISVEASRASAGASGALAFSITTSGQVYLPIGREYAIYEP